MEKVKSHKQIFGMDFPLHAEWDAGYTPFGKRPPGRWTVCRERDCFSVFFYNFETHQEKVLKTFPPTEQGEIEAKKFALKLAELDDEEDLGYPQEQYGELVCQECEEYLRRT